MKSNKRWLFLLTAIIGIIGCADALKATSLFGRIPNLNKTTTTTTTSTVATVDVTPLVDDEKENVKKDVDEPLEDEVTKPPLTGIPQIDYVWDPNLPRELNGYNLSSYPFLNSVPENDDIDFKCDGLHDGFYASIKFSCQLYHHCIYGIRHDFLCANFTAFDQRTFICHFASEVNCKTSAKYWFRNDALYKATTTTSTTTTTQAPPPTTSQAPERIAPRRPLRRRRPQDYYYDDDDYEDEYIEERVNRRRKPIRQRNRRPEYDEEDDRDDRDESYETRPMHRERSRNRDNIDEDDYDYDRRTYERPRSRNRPSDSRRHMDDDRRYEPTEERRPHDKRKPNDRRTSLTDDRRSYGDDRRHNTEERNASANERKVSNEDRRVLYEDRRPSLLDDRRSNNDDRKSATTDDVRRPSLLDDRRSNSDDRKSATTDDVRRPNHDRRRPISERRPQYDDDYDPPRRQQQSDNKDEYTDERPLKRPSKPEIIPKVRSSGSTSLLFNRPRAPPKVYRPVPVNEKKKYEYAPRKVEKAPPAAPASEEVVYDDDYDYEAEPPISHPNNKQEKTEEKSTPPASNQRDQRPTYKGDLANRKPEPYDNEDLEDELSGGSKVTSSKPQRSTLPNSEPNRQQQLIKPEQHDSRLRDSEIKINDKPSDDFSKEDLVAEDEELEYPDEDGATFSDPIEQSDAVVATRDNNESNLRPEHRERTKISQPIAQEAEIEKETIRNQYTKSHRPIPVSNVKIVNDEPPQNYPKGTKIESEEGDIYTVGRTSTIAEPSGFKPIGYNREPTPEIEIDPYKNSRQYVRIMKRPFLPSRGGSPYLPRGLKPVGSGITSSEYSTVSTPPRPSTVSNGIHLLEHSPPIVRINFNSDYSHQQQQQQQPFQQSGPRTTQPPQIESPRNPLDEIYNSDYDVTINDALNPTLKPLTQSHESPIGFPVSKYDRNNPYARSDVSHSPSQFRSTAIRAPVHIQSRKPQIIRQQQSSHQYYDDDYEY